MVYKTKRRACLIRMIGPWAFQVLSDTCSPEVPQSTSKYEGNFKKEEINEASWVKRRKDYDEANVTSGKYSLDKRQMISENQLKTVLLYASCVQAKWRKIV